MLVRLKCVALRRPELAPCVNASAAVVTPSEFSAQIWFVMPCIVAYFGRAVAWEKRAFALRRGGKANGFENAVAIDAKSGKEIERFEGLYPGHFAMPEALSKLTYQRGGQLVLLHNHPASVSLSTRDLRILARPGVKKITAYGQAGAWFAADKGVEIGRLAQALEAANEELATQLHLLKKRWINTDGIEAHIRNLALARAGIIHYTSRLDKNRARLYAKEVKAIEAAVEEIVLAIKRDPSWT